MRRQRDQLNAREAHCHQLRFHLCAAWETPAYKERTYSALAADYYRLTDGRRRCDLEKEEERKPKQKNAPDFCGTFHFSQL